MYIYIYIKVYMYMYDSLPNVIHRPLTIVHV